MKSFKKKGHIRQRRTGVIARLKQQLKDGVKNAKVTETNWAGITATKQQLVPLTDADVKRIKSEIATLEARV